MEARIQVIMVGVEAAVLEEYRPVLEAIATRSSISVLRVRGPG